MGFDLDVAIVGGCGHVGLPLGLAFADRGLQVALYDIDEKAVETVGGGRMPFWEEGAEPVLEKVLAEGRLMVTGDPDVVSRAENVIVVVGTPVDEHLNPHPEALRAVTQELGDHLRDGQLLVLRSTVYPGVTALVEGVVKKLGREIDVSFCPERLAEGRAMVELFELPQIVSGRSAQALERAEKLFRNLTPEVVHLSPEEAELAKLFTNSWRYIRFATANQFFMIANDYGLDFEKIRSALTYNYPRAADMPRVGFTAGPCLLKDTMQIAAFNNNNFVLGHASMMINEGLPLYVVSRIEEGVDLSDKVVGILGMAFKGESDDVRSSLSYKLKRILRFKAKEVLCTDPFVTVDPTLVGLEDVLNRADLLIVGAPHNAYKALDVKQPVYDIWNVISDNTVI